MLKRWLIVIAVLALLGACAKPMDTHPRSFGNGVSVNFLSGRPQIQSTMFVSFASNQTTIDSAFYPYLQSISQAIKAYPNMNVVVIGYTDNQGKLKHNQFLAEQRALNVIAYLEAEGIDSNRLKMIVGEADYIASNKEAAGRAENRRVGIQFN